MHWFYAPEENWSEDRVDLPPDESHHAHKVLRLALGEGLTVTDGRGRVARGAIASIEKSTVGARIEGVTTMTAPSPRFVVYQAALKSGKLDNCVERLAELGVAEIKSFTSQRAVARWDDAKITRLNERYATIVRGAAKRSHNPFLASVEVGLSWDDLLQRISAEPLPMLLWEAATVPLRAVLEPGIERLALVVGPEGGFTSDEAAAMSKAGASPTSLGPQILRAENAALVTTAALMWHYGQFA